MKRSGMSGVAWFVLWFGCLISSGAGAREQAVALDTGSGQLAGVLRLPDDTLPQSVVLMVAGSGPTDRDGNSPVAHNDALRKLSEALAEAGVASLRYDKRGIGASQGAMASEATLRFEHYIDDVAGWFRWLQKDGRFSRIVVLGHSEGALLSMAAARQIRPAGLVSIAGTALPADQLIRRQLAAISPELLVRARPALDRLLAGEQTTQVPVGLEALLRPSVQPYLISWFGYQPQQIIAGLALPLLIIQGDRDTQVGKDDARLLHRAQPDALLHIEPGMNHVLRVVDPGRASNIASYNQPQRPLAPGLVPAIVEFVQQQQTPAQ